MNRDMWWGSTLIFAVVLFYVLGAMAGIGQGRKECAMEMLEDALKGAHLTK